MTIQPAVVVVVVVVVDFVVVVVAGFQVLGTADLEVERLGLHLAVPSV